MPRNIDRSCGQDRVEELVDITRVLPVFRAGEANQPVVITGPQRAVVEAAGVERAGVDIAVLKPPVLVAGVEPAGVDIARVEAAGVGVARGLPAL